MACCPSFPMCMASLIHLVKRSGSLSITVAWGHQLVSSDGDRQRARTFYQVDQRGHTYLKGKTTGHEPWWGQLPTEPRIRPFLDVPSFCHVKNWKNWVKVKVWTLAIALLTWVRLVTSSALQSRKWQLIGMSQWCRSALCGHPLSTLTDNWTHGAASTHTTAPISHTRPSPRSYYSFPVPLRVGGWVCLSTQ